MVDKPAGEKGLRRRRIADKISLLTFFTGVVLILSLFATAFISLLLSPYGYLGGYTSLIFLISVILLTLGIIFKGVGRFMWPKAETLNTVSKPFILKTFILMLILFILLTIGLSYVSSQQSHGPWGPCGGPFSACADKPVIYLYPENMINVSVTLNIPNGYLTATDPTIGINGTWAVIAEPNGKIIQNGTQYPYLFYETKAPWNLSLTTGWVVSKNNITDWFNATLPRMGLSYNETNDFMGYWDQNLPIANYYLISLLNGSQLNKTSVLSISPKPNTTIRVILVIQKLNAPVSIPEPNLTAQTRNGFTAVEWGVILRNFTSG